MKKKSVATTSAPNALAIASAKEIGHDACDWSRSCRARAAESQDAQVSGRAAVVEHRDSCNPRPCRHYPVLIIKLLECQVVGRFRGREDARHIPGASVSLRDRFPENLLMVSSGSAPRNVELMSNRVAEWRSPATRVPEPSGQVNPSCTECCLRGAKLAKQSEPM